MTFKLMSAKSFFTEELKVRYEKLGFCFVPSDFDPKEPWCLDRSDVTLEVNTLEELLSFVEAWGDVIVMKDHEIWIYNDYME